MLRRRTALAALASLALAACGGGGGDDGPNPPPGTFTVSGTISAAAGQVMDSDTADALDVPKTRNDTPGAAQEVTTTSSIGGWAGTITYPNTQTFVDEWDVYRVTLGAGQVAILDIASSTEGDLDLCLFDAANPSEPVVPCSEASDAAREQVAAPAAGTYLVGVRGFAGGSNYVLTFAAVSSGAVSSRWPEFVPGELLVRFRDDGPRLAGARDDADELRLRAAALGLEPLGGAARGREAHLGLGGSDVARARALAALGVERPLPGSLGGSLDPAAQARLDTLLARKALRARPDVVSADLNYVFRPSYLPENEFYAYQWHYPIINLPQAWDETLGSPDVIVAVVDTGVFLGHPDLTGQLVSGYDFISSDAIARDGEPGRDANPDDPGDAATPGGSSWHGTHVAGTVAGRARSGPGALGVAPSARIMPLRVLGAGGGTSADINAALRFAAGLESAGGRTLGPDERPDVVNLSLGCLDCFSATDAAVYAQVRQAGLIVVAAAGNENSALPGYPASYDGVVSVAAVDLNLARAPYSNRGPNVDVAAPGGNTGVDLNGDRFADGVLSAVANDESGTRVAEWRFYQGTSMASPHFAGVVALMKSVCGSLTAAQLDGILASGAMTRDLGTLGRDDVFGHGLVDALAAVQAARLGCGQAVPPGVEATPVTLDFGTSATSLDVTTRLTGEGALAITGVSEDASWITSVAPKAGATLTNGFGPYTVTVDRSGLTSGRYAARVRFARDDGGTAEVPVTMQVGAAAGPGDAGFLYVLLLDESFDPVAQLQGSGAGGGSYPFSFGEIAAGSYFIVAGTDSDNDDVICDEGEVCGAWPTLGLPTPLEVGANQPGRDFGVGLELGLGTLRAGATEGGWRKLPTGSKSFGGAR